MLSSSRAHGIRKDGDQVLMQAMVGRPILKLMQDSKFLPISFLLFVSIRLLLICFVPATDPFSDAAWYLDRATTLAEQGTYSERGIPTAFWPVGYPAFLGLLFKVTGVSLLAAKLANLVLSAISFWLLYFLVRRTFHNELAARGAVLLLAIYPNNAAYVSLLLTETLYTFLLLAATLCLVLRRTWWTVILSGVVFGLAILVKTQTILLIPFLALLAFLDDWSTRSFPRAIIRSGAVVCVALVVVTPWSLRNHDVFGTLVFVSTNGGMSLLAGNNPSVVGDYRTNFSDTDPLFEQARFSVEDQIGADRARARLP